MNTYTLTVAINVDADHLFPAIMRVQDALKGVGRAIVSWDEHDPQSNADYRDAAALLAPADES